MITAQPEQTESIGLAGNSTALATIIQGSGGNTWTSDSHQAEPPTSCLYFLVCGVSEGPLAGLVKAGVADYLPARYQQHTRTWGSFDLDRSALVRTRSVREAEHLENALRKVFGNPVEESKAKKAGKTLTSKDFIALKSCRRYPGRKDDGCTEFFTVDCLDEMLRFAENWLAGRGERGAGAYLQRGINQADCALPGRGDVRAPLLTKEERRKRREQQHAASQRASEKLRAQYEGIIALVLDLALTHERDIIWVDLSLWYKLRAGGVGAIAAWGLVDLYFDHVGPAPSTAEIRSGRRSAAQLRREESFTPVAALVASMDSNEWHCTSGRSPGGACYLQERNNVLAGYLPHQSCADKPLLRLESGLFRPPYPLFEEFESLAQRVKNRRFEQLVLC